MTVGEVIDTLSLGGMQSPLPVLPTEIWLQIFENIRDPEYLWTIVRHVSIQNKALVERVFATDHVPFLSISLSLPRRDPTTGALRWPGTPIPKAQITMTFNRFNAKQRRIVLASPTTLTDGANTKTVEELRNTSALSKERLEAAPAWVNLNKNPLAGLSMHLPICVEWDEAAKVWLWELEWRPLVTRFFVMKNEKRTPRRAVKFTSKAHSPPRAPVIRYI